ncbi:Vacuolar protein sorting 26 [Giardia muris]|uniref:Vacuolar protein sorting 26 n=1 Tax=Giardia muris TaxID=5742 RepID=A0A4Z1SL86_GIAMU|nr:Vacuolar protein sorting 26 [Giardia muris]|eukprot:TNJ26392.1 Vacuolar protein sorting 26 [Giardia muris]
MSRASKSKGSKGISLHFDWNVPVFTTLPQTVRQFDDGSTQTVVIVPAETSLTGSVTVSNPGGKPLAYENIVVELQGVIETTEDPPFRSTFFSVARIVKNAGQLAYPEIYAFDFTGHPLPCETINAPDSYFTIKYYLSCTLKTKSGPLSGDLEFACIKYLPPPPEVMPIRTEVGVEDKLQLELEFNNTFLDISCDLLVGRVHFVHVAKKLEEMAIIVRRRELYKKSRSSSEWTCSPWSDIFYCDIMEGSPTREEVVPFRIYLGHLPLSPSFTTEMAKIEYVAVLSLIDSEGKSYFRSQELSLYRGIPDGERVAAEPAKNLISQQQQQQTITGQTIQPPMEALPIGASMNAGNPADPPYPTGQPVSYQGYPPYGTYTQPQPQLQVQPPVGGQMNAPPYGQYPSAIPPSGVQSMLPQPSNPYAPPAMSTVPPANAAAPMARPGSEASAAPYGGYPPASTTPTATMAPPPTAPPAPIQPVPATAPVPVSAPAVNTAPTPNQPYQPPPAVSAPVAAPTAPTAPTPAPAHVQPGTNPYATSGTANPYARPAGSGPAGYSPPKANPYASTNPYASGAQAQGTNPYQQPKPQGNPYAAPPAGAAKPSPTANPYAAANPYSGGYTQPSQAPSYTQF